VPTYEYLCEKCGHEFEREQRISDPPVRTCPECRARKVKKLISRTSFVLKGGGWYSDLYATPKAAGSKSESGLESASASESSTGSKSDAAETSEAKPEKSVPKSPQSESAKPSRSTKTSKSTSSTKSSKSSKSSKKGRSAA
jgi:putative FmdB family regulatory protein